MGLEYDIILPKESWECIQEEVAVNQDWEELDRVQQGSVVGCREQELSHAHSTEWAISAEEKDKWPKAEDRQSALCSRASCLLSASAFLCIKAIICQHLLTLVPRSSTLRNKFLPFRE